jgi:hypothetical protein
MKSGDHTFSTPRKKLGSISMLGMNNDNVSQLPSQCLKNVKEIPHTLTIFLKKFV